MLIPATAQFSPRPPGSVPLPCKLHPESKEGYGAAVVDTLPTPVAASSWPRQRAGGQAKGDGPEAAALPSVRSLREGPVQVRAWEGACPKHRGWCLGPSL